LWDLGGPARADLATLEMMVLGRKTERAIDEQIFSLAYETCGTKCENTLTVPLNLTTLTAKATGKMAETGFG
jgi:hypothetical protein